MSEIQIQLERYLVYLVKENALNPETANTYLAHALRHLYETRVISDPAEMRTYRLNQVLSGLRNEYNATHPVRDRQRVPITLDFILLCKPLFGEWYDRETAEMIYTALLVGFATSLRPEHYLITTTTGTYTREHVGAIRLGSRGDGRDPGEGMAEHNTHRDYI